MNDGGPLVSNTYIQWYGNPKESNIDFLSHFLQCLFIDLLICHKTVIFILEAFLRKYWYVWTSM